MKISKIKEYLDSYDENSGTGRFFIDESHISELRQFYKEVVGVNGELTPKEQLKVVRICLRKKNWNDSESSKTLEGLLKELGGKTALQRLKENKLLKAVNVVLLEKYKHVGDNLSQLIEVLKGYSLDVSLTDFVQDIDLVNIHEKLKDIVLLKEAKLLSRRTLLLTANSQASCSMASTIKLLQTYGIGEQDLDCLPPTLCISSIYKIIQLFAQINPGLIQTNLSAICKLEKDSFKFWGLIKELSFTKDLVTQKTIETCLDHRILEASFSVKDILGLFREAGWLTERNLDAILTSVIKGDNLKIHVAVETLKNLKLEPAHAQCILDALFKKPTCNLYIIEAVTILLQNKLLNDENLTVILGEPEHADKLANAIKILKAVSLDDKENKDLISKVPAFADSVATVFKQLVKAKQFSSTTRALALEQAENAEVTAKILRFLRIMAPNKEAKEQSLSSFCEELLQKKLMTVQFSDLLSDLEDADILNATNIKKLIENAAYIRTLASACCCLAYGETLNQTNFDLLFDDPKRALAIAAALEGRVRPRTDGNDERHRIDKGAKDFLDIKRAAQFLALGQRGGAFFQPATINKKQLRAFCQLTKRDPIEFAPEVQREEQRSLFIKIAQMCGNGQLEDETERCTAADVFTTFKV